MYRNSLRGALLASTAFVMFGSGAALAQAGGSCTITDGAQVCEGAQATFDAYSFGLDSFTNSGSLNSTFTYLDRSYTAFSFLNTESGVIISLGYPRPAVVMVGSNLSDNFDVESFVNLGIIGSTVGVGVFTEDTVSIGRFENSGIIAAVGEGDTPGGCFFAENYAVEIQGRITGDFVNTGIILGTDTAVHVAEIGGDFINEDQITVLGGVEFGNSAVRLGSLEGSFFNRVDGEISGFTDAVHITVMGGDFVNEGLISGEVEAIHIGAIDGDFRNYGTIESVTNLGAGATWIGYLRGDFLNDTDGQILSADYGIAVANMAGESFTNQGLISSFYGAVQIQFPSASFTFTNSGDILSSGSYGVTLGSGYGPGAEGQAPGPLNPPPFEGAVTFNNEGNIIAHQSGIIAYATLASFSNSGLIDGGVTGAFLGNIQGSFSNTGDIIGGYAALELNYLTGDFVNEGLIEAVRGYVVDRGPAKPGEAVPYYANGTGFSGASLDGDFFNLGRIRGATTGVAINSLTGVFINQGLIESTTISNVVAPGLSGAAANSYYSNSALYIGALGGGVEAPLNAGVGSAISAEDFSFYNGSDAQIIGAAGGVMIGNFSGPGFYNAGLISSVYDAVTIDRAFNQYAFINAGDILSSEGVGVSLGILGLAPTAEPLGLAAARSGGEYGRASTVEFANSGSIIAGQTGVDIGNEVYIFQNEGLISGGDYGVRLRGQVYAFINGGTITASGSAAPPSPPKQPIYADLTPSTPALSSRALGDAVSLQYVTGGFGNGPDASIIGELRGVNAFLVNNFFVNYGFISGGYQGVSIYSLDGDFVNEGTIEQVDPTDVSDAAAVSLVYFSGPEGFHNGLDGEILGQAEGVHIYEFYAGNFLNEGLISSVGDAVTIGFVNGERVFENSGVITSSTGTAVRLSHVAGGEPAAEGSPIQLSFLNTGTIDSTVLGVRIDGFVGLFENRADITGGKVAIDLHGDVETLTNYGSILANQTGIRFNDNIGFLYNAGRITGLSGGMSGTGAGLRVYGNAGTVLMNAAGGIISGFTGVALGAGDDNVTNAGIMTGTGGVAASLGGGDDSFFSYGIGTISGSVDGGADYDTFIANGTQTLDMAIENFEEMWLIGGDITFGHDHAANFMLSRGDSLDLAGFTFTGDLLSTADLYAEGGTVDGSVLNFGSILALDLTITGDLHNGGVINPGGTGAIGTLTVLGDFYALNLGDPVETPGGQNADTTRAPTLSPSGSTLVFNFSGLNHDQIIVTGAASLGGDLLVTGNLADAMKARQDFTLVSATSMSGNYNLLNLAGVLFAPEVNTVGSDLMLSFAQNNFVAALAPATVNQNQAALGLEDRWNLGASAADDIVLALNAGASSALILEAFAPETSAALTRQSARIGTQLAQTVANCAIGPNAGACGRRTSEGGVMIWTNVSGSEANLKGDGNAAGVDEAFSQVSSGAELAFNQRFTGGIFLASGTGDVDIADGQRGHGEIDAVAGGIYARMQAGRFTLAGLAGYADTDIEARRHTPLGTSIGETGGSVSFARLDARLTLISGVSQAGFAMSGTYAYAEIGNFAQRGADGYDLDIVGDSYRVEDWELRGFFGHDFEPTQSGYLVSFGATAGMVHANGEDTASVGASFPGASAVYEALGPRSNDTGGVAGGFINLASPLAGVAAQIGVEGRWMEGEDSSRVYGRFAWTF